MLAGGALILGLWARRRDPAYGLFAVAALLWGSHTLVSLLPEPPLPQPHWFVWWHGDLHALRRRCCACSWSASPRSTGARYRRAVIAFALVRRARALCGGGAATSASRAAVAVRGTAIVLVLVALYARTYARAVRVRNAENLLLLAHRRGLRRVRGPRLDAPRNSDAVRPVWLVPYAALAFLLLVGWILTDRFVRALNDSERAQRRASRRAWREKSAALTRQLAATREARDAAEAANVAKSRFLAAASHDLRQPLHALGLFASALAERRRRTPEQAAPRRSASRSRWTRSTRCSRRCSTSRGSMRAW